MGFLFWSLIISLLALLVEFLKPNPTVENDCKNQVRHQTSFRIMHVISITDPSFGLPSNLAFFSLDKLFWGKPVTVMVDQVFNDEPGFCQQERLGSGFQFNFEDWRFSKWMNLFQFRRRLSICPPFIGLELVFEVQRFQEPYNYLRSRFVKPKTVD